MLQPCWPQRPISQDSLCLSYSTTCPTGSGASKRKSLLQQAIKHCQTHHLPLLDRRASSTRRTAAGTSKVPSATTSSRSCGSSNTERAYLRCPRGRLRPTSQWPGEVEIPGSFGGKRSLLTEDVPRWPWLSRGNPLGTAGRSKPNVGVKHVKNEPPLHPRPSKPNILTCTDF